MRAVELLRTPDFRRLLAARMASQFADGIFIDAVLLTVVFLPERQDTVRGFALATALLLVPFSVLGPFAGVFVDRWSRKRILVVLPPLRAAAALLAVGAAPAAATYLGALVVFSANRLFQATVTAVVPRVVEEVSDAYGREEPTLFAANATIAAGGSLALFGGLFAGAQLAPRVGAGAVILVACAAWVVSALSGLSLSTTLRPGGRAAAPLRGELSTVAHELLDGVRRIVHTPAAFAPITAVAVNQVLQMVVIVVCIVLFKVEVGGGMISFSWLLGAGGVGVLAGFLSVRTVRRRAPDARVIALSFVLSALALAPAILALGAATLFAGALPMGIAYAWTKVPADTLAQRAVPDRYRGRVFTVMDLGFNMARVLAALAAIPLVPLLGLRATLAVTAAAFLLFAPVVPCWLAGGGGDTRRRRGSGRQPDDAGAD